MASNEVKEQTIKTVLITGGNGCLGRYLVKLIRQEMPSVVAIRIFDQNESGQAYFAANFTQGRETKLEYLVGDLRNIAELERAVQDVDCVFHMAAVVDVSMFPDDNLMWNVNCRGTQNLVEACYAACLPYIIHTSSVNAVLGRSPSHLLTEKNSLKPTRWFWNGYGETKWYSEQIIQNANGVTLPNGKLLRTVCLRPTLFYGENDFINVAKYITTARACGGTLMRFSGWENMIVQQTYIGNVAWAHISALRALMERPDCCGGQAYFVTDDTPITDIFTLSTPFLEDQGMRLSRIPIPFFLVFYIIILLKFVLSIFKTCCPNVIIPLWLRESSSQQLNFLRLKCSFCRDSADADLRYRPIFPFKVAVENSRLFYKRFV